MPSKSKSKSSGQKATPNPLSQQGPSGNAKSDFKAASTTVASTDRSNPSLTQSSQTQAPHTEPQSPPSAPQSAQEHGSNAASGVNRKKQKRRMKEAAKRAAAEPNTANPSVRAANTNGYDYGTSDYDGTEPYEQDEGDDVYYTDEASRNYVAEFGSGMPQANGYSNHNYISHGPLGVGKKKKKQRANVAHGPSHQTASSLQMSNTDRFQRPPPPPPPPLTQSQPTPISQPARDAMKDRIWNTSTAEERERIKEFWLSLGEGDRRGLVRIEKEAVLKKMKEQQKHSCSCTVCGRKRTAIEEELEVLYDAYYEELETYANHQQFGLDASSIPPPRSYARPRPPLPSDQYPSLRGGESIRGHVEELGDADDAGDEEDYSEEDEDDDLSEDEVDPPMGPSGGIFNFGNSLTAQGGILTVADDLLKNDGKKFIEMMEQLAERRMQREEESRMVASGMGHPSMRQGPSEEEEDGYDDEEDEEDYNSEEDEEFEDDEMAMTEEQRMEEGRRMFQIFAARMFEQRVLNAYRQKVAEERQKKLIEELAEDEQLDAQREAKKAKEAQKKKDKRQKQKQAKDEEKAKKDAEKAAQEAAARAIEEKKLEEQRQRKEEQRKKKEAEKKAAEDERKRKEEEKQRQIQEKKEQQAELERKQREQKEREKRKKDEAKKKEREDREAKDNEARERKDRELTERKEREAKQQMASAAKERIKQEEAAARAKSATSKRQSPANVPSAVLPTPSSLQPPPNASNHPSPRLPIATPVLPKAPTPGRPRQKSVQDSRTASPKPSQPVSSSTASPATSSEPQIVPAGVHSRKPSQPGATQPPPLQPRFSPIGAPPGIPLQPPGFGTPMSSNGFPSNFGPPLSPRNTTHLQHPPGFPHQYPIPGNHFRNMNMPPPPGMNTTRQFPPNQHINTGVPLSHGPESSSANNAARFGMVHNRTPPYTHSRNQSVSSTVSPKDSNAHPAPIQRPSSVAPNQQIERVQPSSRDIDDLSNHLGSSALLDDTDVAPDSAIEELRRGSMAVGGPRATRQAFGSAPGLGAIGTSTSGHHPGNMWSTPQTPFGAPSRPAQPFGSSAPGFGRPVNESVFGSGNSQIRSNAPRALRIRVLASQTCDKWTAYSPANQGWHPAEQVLKELQISMPRNEPPLHMMEMLQMCETEGNAQNGGGRFEFQGSQGSPFLLRHHTEQDISLNGRSGPPLGEIGSPIVGAGGNKIPQTWG